MSLDFVNKSSIGPQYSLKLTVYGSQEIVPLSNPKFTNASLITPTYTDSSSNIKPIFGPNLTTYKTNPTTVYPFTYIATHYVNNYLLSGQMAQTLTTTPKISVYTQDPIPGTLVYSFDYTGTGPLDVNNYLPIITGTGLTIVNSNAIKTGNSYSVTVNISYIDDNTDFGLSFYTSDNTKINFYNLTEVNNLTISTLTNIPLSKSGYQFAGLTKISIYSATNTVVPIIFPNTSLLKCFYNCSNFNSDISKWDTSNIQNMSYMFSGCSAFDKSIVNWDTSSVQNMSYMFSGCSTFDKKISFWNISNVIDMSYMFNGCIAFTNAMTQMNPNTVSNSWNTSNVTDMSYMFNGCTAFYQNISDWDTSNVTNMSYMFYNCINFNSKLNWNTTNVTNISYIFYGATIFNNSGNPGIEKTPMTTYNNWTWITLPTVYSNWHASCALTIGNAPTLLRDSQYW